MTTSEEQVALQGATERPAPATPDPIAAYIVTAARIQLLEFLVSALFLTHPSQASVLARLESMLQAHRRIAESSPDEGSRGVLLAINDVTRALGNQFQAQQQGAPGLH